MDNMQWCVLMRWDDYTGNWYRGPERFPTREDAEEYGWNEWQRHPSMKEYRVMPMPDGEAAGGK